MPSHTIQQGEHLTRIAKQYGFYDYHTIWNDPRNADLRSKRKNPSVLYPGDILYIPDKTPKIEQRSTGQLYKFQVPVETLKLRITLRDFDSRPIANADCELQVEGQIYKLTSNGAGLIQQEIPVTAETGTLRIPKLELEFPVRVGHLDPHDEDSGWRARLVNLGYLPGGTDDLSDDQFRWAVEEFQCDNKLKVTGKLDASTKSKLQDSHGV